MILKGDEEMATYLLTYNDEKWKWNDIDLAINEIKNAGRFISSWSSGKRKKINVGERVYVIKLGSEPKGILASGWVYNGWHEDRHWDNEKAMQGKKANYIDVNFEFILNPEKDEILSIEGLNKGLLKNMDWYPIASGVIIPEKIAEKLEEKWSSFIKISSKSFNERIEILPEEIFSADKYIEGATTKITVNSYERNADARAKCIKIYGYNCFACGCNLEKIYGERAKNFIHVHHTIPLSETNSSYKVDPKKDLKPLCPNCHAVIHRYKPVLTIDQLKQLLFDK